VLNKDYYIVCLYTRAAFVQIFKANKTTTGSSTYLNDAILHGIEGLQKVIIYDRSLQPAGNLLFDLVYVLIITEQQLTICACSVIGADVRIISCCSVTDDNHAV